MILGPSQATTTSRVGGPFQERLDLPADIGDPGPQEVQVALEVALLVDRPLGCAHGSKRPLESVDSLFYAHQKKGNTG